MSCKGILPQTRNGSGQIEDILKKELPCPPSYRKNVDINLGSSRTLLPDNNQDVAEDGVNGENISPSVLEISSSNFTLPSSEITSDVVGVSVDDWFKTRSDGMDLDSVLTTDELGVNDLEGYQFTSSKENVDMCVVTSICDMGLGFDLPVNICDKSSKILGECDRVVNSDEYEGTFLDDFQNSDVVDKNLLVKRTGAKLNEDCKELNSNYILQTEDRDMKDVQKSWSDNGDVFMEIEPVILNEDDANWESLSTGSQHSTDYESEKDDFPEFSLMTFQVDNAEGVNVINSLSQMDCISESNLVPANYIVSDGCVLSDAVSFSNVGECEPQIEGMTKPRLLRGNKSGTKKNKNGSNSEVLVEECVVESLPINASNCTKNKSIISNATAASNPRSVLRLTPKSTTSKSAIEPDSLVKKVSETCNLLPTPVKAEILETENSLRMGSSKKAPAMTIIAISTDKLKNTTEIVINTSQGEQKFKGKTSDFIKATSKLISNQPLKARIGQSLNLSNMEMAQEEMIVQQNENVSAEGWSKFDRSKAADEQPIMEALATLGIDLSSLNYVTAGGNGGYKLWVCPTENCNKLYPRLSLLKVHILTHYGVRPYRCDIPGCQWTFYTCFKLKRHKETHLKKKAFICPVPSCGHRFTTIYNLKTHRKLHERPAKLQCPVVGCDAHFQTKRAVELHVKKHGISHAPYQCTFAGCGKRYYSSNTLNSHARSHQHREEEVRCQWPDCGKWFDKPCRLKAHMRTHTGDKPYLCTYENCGWAFSSASKLKRHQQKHTNERKFFCSFEGCGKSFMRSEHLKEHMQTHVGERSYQCTVENCGVKFTAKSSLYVHLKKHKLQMKDGKLAMESRTVSRFQSTNGASTSTSTAGTTVNSRAPSAHQQQQKKSNVNGVPKVLSSNGPVQVVMPVTASSNSFHCPVDSCPKSYSCKASLRHHLLKHHTPVLASDANQLDYVTSLLLSGGSNQQVIISSSDNEIAAAQGSVCTVAVADAENNDSSGLLSTGTIYETADSYPSEYISTDLLNSQLNNMLIVATAQENSQEGMNGQAVLLSNDDVTSEAALAEAELRLATESIKDPLLVEDYQTSPEVSFDIPELTSTEEVNVPDDPSCRCARTSLTFQDIVQRKRPHLPTNSTTPRKAIVGGAPSVSHIDNPLTVGETLGMDGNEAVAMAGTIAGLRDPVAALRLPPDMAGLLAPTADLNLLLQTINFGDVCIHPPSDNHQDVNGVPIG